MKTPEQKSKIDVPTLGKFKRLFFPRLDTYAIQRRDGTGFYTNIKQPVTGDLLLAHFHDEITLGTYCLSFDNKAHFTALDVDSEDVWQSILAAITKLKTPFYLEPSRRGGHVWFFHEYPVSGSEALNFGLAVIGRLSLEEIEVYPKQGDRQDGLGSLIRVPLGFHHRMDPPKRYIFQTPAGAPLASTVRDQIALIADAQRVPYAFLQALTVKWGSEKQTSQSQPSQPLRVRSVDSRLPLSERIKQAIPVREFVERYVVLDRRGMGLCPFHDDHNPSFGVDDHRNFWHCYAGCGGGSIVDFWMLYREQVLQKDGSFTETIKDLARILGL